MFFEDNPEIMDKLIDTNYIPTTTAAHKGTEENYQLWAQRPPPSYKDIVYDGREDMTKPVDIIVNYEVPTITQNLLTAKMIGAIPREDPVIPDVYNPIHNELDENTTDREQNHFVGSVEKSVEPIRPSLSATVIAKEHYNRLNDESDQIYGPQNRAEGVPSVPYGKQFGNTIQ